jgi:hypothetical protein
MRRYWHSVAAVALLGLIASAVGCKDDPPPPTTNKAPDGGQVRPRPGDDPSAKQKKTPPRLDD